MSRIRSIKPGLFTDADLFDAEQETGLPLRLAYPGLWTCCDREGRFKWKPRELKIAVLPFDELDFSRVLDALESRGYVVRYEVGTASYGYIPSWKRHQFINNKEAASELPEPPQNLILNASVTREHREVNASDTRGVKATDGWSTKLIGGAASLTTFAGALGIFAKMTGLSGLLGWAGAKAGVGAAAKGVATGAVGATAGEESGFLLAMRSNGWAAAGGASAAGAGAGAAAGEGAAAGGAAGGIIFPVVAVIAAAAAGWGIGWMITHPSRVVDAVKGAWSSLKDMVTGSTSTGSVLDGADQQKRDQDAVNAVKSLQSNAHSSLQSYTPLLSWKPGADLAQNISGQEGFRDHVYPDVAGNTRCTSLAGARLTRPRRESYGN